MTPSDLRRIALRNADEKYPRLNDRVTRVLLSEANDGCCGAFNAGAELFLPALVLAMESLRKNTGHLECDDSWYSCPLSEGGCADDSREKKCNCGAQESIEALAKISAMLGDGKRSGIYSKLCAIHQLAICG